MMDVMGLCEGCGQMPVAFLVLALSGGVQLGSPGKYFMQTKVGPEAPHLKSGSLMSQTPGILACKRRGWGGEGPSWNLIEMGSRVDSVASEERAWSLGHCQSDQE